MVPQEQLIEAADAQEAHNYVSKMLSARENDAYPHPSLHSIEEIEEQEIVFTPDFELG
jgi:hypothetical protein